MTRFENGKNYKLYRQNGQLAERTAKCTGINRKVGKIRFDIIGSELESFAKQKTVVLDLLNDDKTERASSLDFRQYLAIFATDAF